MVMSLERCAKELDLTLKAMICKRERVLRPGFCFVLFCFTQKILSAAVLRMDQGWDKLPKQRQTDGRALVIV